MNTKPRTALAFTVRAAASRLRALGVGADFAPRVVVAEGAPAAVADLAARLVRVPAFYVVFEGEPEDERLVFETDPPPESEAILDALGTGWRAPVGSVWRFSTPPLREPPEWLDLEQDVERLELLQHDGGDWRSLGELSLGPRPLRVEHGAVVGTPAELGAALEHLWTAFADNPTLVCLEDPEYGARGPRLWLGAGSDPTVVFSETPRPFSRIAVAPAYLADPTGGRAVGARFSSAGVPTEFRARNLVPRRAAFAAAVRFLSDRTLTDALGWE